MDDPQLDRRSFLGKAALASPACAFFGDSALWAQAGSSTLTPLNRFPRMMQESMVRRLREASAARIARIEGLRSRADAEAYVQEVRLKIRQSFGPFPDKTPLNARVTGVLERDTYRVENVIFESRPGFLVTGNLYVPKALEGRAPGIIGTCGHSSNGKAAEPYQAFAQGLARQGYVVLIFDPIGQGERLQYPDESLKSTVGVGVREHLYAGNPQFLVAEFFGTWRAWDGVRALDYLLTRPEVDPQHLGLTGNSGGGTMTTWLCGLDPRYTMAAPSCFVTSFRRNLENELPADTEQCPPWAIALGLDHEDFLAAMAPKPVIILAKERDYFDVRGSEAAYKRLQHLYQLLGAENNIGLFVGPTTHGYSQENREAMYGWFNGITGVAEGNEEPDIVQEKDEALYAAPRGQVVTLGSKTVPQFTQEKAEALARERGQPSGRALLQALRKVLPLARREAVPENYRILRARRSRRYPAPHATTYAVETEPGIQALVYRLDEERRDSRPPRGVKSAVLYVSHLSSDAELREEAWLRSMYRERGEAEFYACDLRGSGESQPDTCGANSFLQPYGSDYFYAIHSIMLGDPYPAQRVRDLLAVMAWLEQLGRRKIHLVAMGRGTVPAVLAAILSDDVPRVSLRDPLESFDQIVSSETYDWPLSSFVPNILKYADLPDVYRDLEGQGKLTLIQES